MSQATDNPRAGALFTGAVTAFTVNDSLVKGLAGDLAVPQILFFRGAVLTMLYLILFRRVGEAVTLGQMFVPMNLVRGGIEGLISLLFFHALQALPLATVLALFFTTPVVGTALAALVLREKVGPRRWSAVLVGLVGVVVFLGVDTIDWRPAVALPLIVAVLVAFRDALTRRMPAQVNSATVTTTTALSTALVGFVMLPIGWIAPSAAALAVLMASVATSGIAFWLYVVATRLGEMSFLAPFRYLALPLGAAIGYLVWGEVPLPREGLGALLIAGSGLFIMVRERSLARSPR